MARARARVVRVQGRMARRWTAQALVETVPANTTLRYDIVLPSDYRQQATLEPTGVTLARIRGSMAIKANGTTGVETILFMGIVFCDFDIAVANTSPANAQHLIDEQWLWTKTAMVYPGGTAAVQPAHIEVDVKAKRKMDDDRVALVVANGSLIDSVTFIAQFRALLLGG